MSAPSPGCPCGLAPLQAGALVVSLCKTLPKALTSQEEAFLSIFEIPFLSLFPGKVLLTNWDLLLLPKAVRTATESAGGQAAAWV